MITVPTTEEARRNGEELAAFLDRHSNLVTAHSIATYLALRKVGRYRVIVYPCHTIIFQLPEAKRRIMHDVAFMRSAGCTWLVEPLRWWQRGRKFVDRLASCDVVG